MKTKAFLLATAGSTVDGRTIDDKMIEEMASSYDPKTYGARLNIEHIRGFDGNGPFRAFGDVLELSTGETEVNFNGKMEKRKALFGVFDVTDDAKKLNGASQKVYPSIEIEPDFGGKGFAYLMGCALTDSPASIATERLQFNRSLPGAITLSLDTAAALEFDDDKPGDGATSFLSSLGTLLDGFASKFGAGKETQPAQEPKPQDQPAAQIFDFSQFRGMFEEFGKTINASIDGLRTEFRGEVDGLGVKLKKLAEEQEDTPSHLHRARPQAKHGGGGKGDYSGIF